MDQALTWLRKQPLWVSTLIGMSLAGGGSGLFEYWLTGGVSGLIPVLVGLVGALILTGWTALMEKSEQPERSVFPMVAVLMVGALVVGGLVNRSGYGVTETPEQPVQTTRPEQPAQTTRSKQPAQTTRSKQPVQTTRPEQPAQTARSKQPAQTIRPERVFCPKSPSQLIALIKGLTQIEAEAVTKPHIGTWMKVQGRVREVKKRRDTIFVLLRPEEPYVTASFDRRWFGRVQNLSVQEAVTIVGKIVSIHPTGAGHIALEESELPNR